MTNNKRVVRIIQALGIFFVVLATYNIALFGIANFEGHGAAFWISYVFMMVAFFVVLLSVAIVIGTQSKPKDWLLGYPIFSHCTAYFIVEFISSIAFMILDLLRIPWGIPIAVQVIVLGVHLVFNISCFITKSTVKNIQESIKQKTVFIESIRVDIEMLAASAKNDEIKAAYEKLAEEARYSDPVSSPMLFDVEQRLAIAVHRAHPFVENNDKLHALSCCNQISLLLSERNKKCKIYK